MRTNRFTFKKTQRVKTVTVVPAISIDLTKEEAAEILLRINEGSGPDEDCDEPKSDDKQGILDCMVYDLCANLRAFIGPRELKKGDRIYKPGRTTYGDRSFGYVPAELSFFTNGKFADGRGWRFCDTDEEVVA